MYLPPEKLRKGRWAVLGHVDRGPHPGHSKSVLPGPPLDNANLGGGWAVLDENSAVASQSLSLAPFSSRKRLTCMTLLTLRGRAHLPNLSGAYGNPVTTYDAV